MKKKLLEERWMSWLVSAILYCDSLTVFCPAKEMATWSQWGRLLLALLSIGSLS